MFQKGDKVRSKELPCLGVGEVMSEQPQGKHHADDPMEIITVWWSQDPHGHLPEDHTPMEDWDFTDLELANGL